jgi:uncharacterized membrane-anchored protein
MTALPIPRASSAWLNKVPLITATFWVIKILSTTIGETFADYLAVNVGLGPAVTDGIMFAALAVALMIQFRTRAYTPWIYWTTVVLVSVVGTQITDFFTDNLGVSLYVSTGVFAVLLAVVFTVWFRREGTLSIKAVDSPPREAFYWGAILTTFALGTASGDLATEALSLGFRNGVVIFGALIFATWVIYRIGGGVVLTFWIAYILTRPLGASIGDFLTQDKPLGGLGLGASLTSLLFLTVIVVLVAREQVLATRETRLGRTGTAAADRSVASRRADLIWATAGLAVVVVAGAQLSRAVVTDGSGRSGLAAAAPIVMKDATTRGSHKASTPVAVKPITALGDLSSLTVTVSDVSAAVAKNDFPGAKTRIKDLEVAWDSAEAGLKPRDPQDWHTLDGAIDAALTAVRASSPSQSESASALSSLTAVINKFDGV